MVEIRSGHKREVLESRWDEMTSPARFAGCDDTMDLIFVAKRSGGRVRLVRKARIAHEPFCCVFRGKISGSGSGSVIKGVFTKSVADYIFWSHKAANVCVRPLNTFMWKMQLTAQS